MKRTAAIFSAILMGTAMASYPALAQSSSGSSNSMNGSMSSGTNQMNTNQMNSKSGATDQMTTGSTKMGTMSNAQIVGKLKAANPSSINIINMNAAHSKSNTAQSAPTNTTPQEQQKLQAAIESNSKLMQALQKKSVQPSQVVAASVGAGDAVTLYVKK
ncbi:MAG TPA: hypothetical protein VFJ18_09535 [Pararhizobium sp.]|nr:hypothetical protein [Pararhizobium sp.]